MKKIFCFSLFCFYFLGFLVGEEANNTYPVTPISILCSSFCPKSSVWVQAKVKEAQDTDTYIIEDSSGTIILFLPTEELEAVPLHEGKKVLVYGRVDISPVRPEKNELYAEKVILLEE